MFYLFFFSFKKNSAISLRREAGCLLMRLLVFMKKGLLTLLFLFAVIRGYGQCTLSVNVTSSSPAICSGTSVVLTATATAGTPPYRYVWSTGETTSSISVNKAGTYTVTVSDNTAGCQPVMQNITITDGVVPNAPTVKKMLRFVLTVRLRSRQRLREQHSTNGMMLQLVVIFSHPGRYLCNAADHNCCHLLCANHAQRMYQREGGG